MPSFKLNCPDSKPYFEASSLAVAIGNPNPSNPEQFHIGILYKFDSKQYLLHMAWHDLFQNEDSSTLNNEYYWVDCGLSEDEKEFLALQCHRIYAKNGSKIPYGINPESCHFDPITAKFVVDEKYGGLTCSTFILELFEASALPLIVKEGWPRRKNKNRKWQRQIIRDLKKHSTASQDHLNAQTFTVKKGALRFPPHEVAAAAARSPHPQRFAWVLDDSIYISDTMLGRL